MTDSERKALEEFQKDIDDGCLDSLNPWTNKVNIFEVLKLTNMEIRHSNVLAWLFDPHENHSLGDAFIRAFINYYAKEYDKVYLLSQDFSTYLVDRESYHMDIVLHSKEEKTIIVIENKIWADESKHQLSDYDQKVDEYYVDYERVEKIFLTPNGHDSSMPDRWFALSYQAVLSALDSAVDIRKPDGEAALIIDNYMDIVRWKIMEERDEELVSACKEIYHKHRKALELIFDNTGMDRSFTCRIIQTTLEELCAEGLIKYDSDVYYGGVRIVNFGTKAMDDFLSPLKEPMSSWGTNSVYAYWFEINDKKPDHLRIYFELGGKNLDEERMKRSERIISASGKKVRDNYTYMRQYHFDAKISDTDYEASLKEAVKTLVHKALKKEKAILEKANAMLNAEAVS